MPPHVDLLQGTLDMLEGGPPGPLARLWRSPAHSANFEAPPGNPAGSLYPALYRLEHQGWITSEWGESENKRQAKHYRVTVAGKRRLRAERENRNRMASVIVGILRTSPEEI
jgi:PadR family transcriptional regulator, regulatory protein PadR